MSAAPVLAQARAKQAPSISIDSLAGRDSFERYCASCHGTAGHGDGPVASELRARPVSAHGTSEMPVWGPMFRMFESDGRVRERIENLLTYLESLQRPPTGADDPGAQAF